MSELARRITPYVGQLNSAHGAAAGAAVERRFAPLGALFDSLSRVKAAILSSGELSGKGKEAKIGDLAAGDGAAAVKRLLAIKEAIRKEFADLMGDETAAQQALVKDPGGSGGYVRDGSARIEPTPANVMLAVEVRAQLQRMKRHEVQEAYLQAVAGEAADPMLIFAVENVPSPRFALVTQNVIDTAREIRISRSQMRASIEMQRDSYDVNSLLFEIAWRELYALIPGVPDVQADPPLPQRRNVRQPFGLERTSQQLAS